MRASPCPNAFAEEAGWPWPGAEEFFDVVLVARPSSPAGLPATRHYAGFQFWRIHEVGKEEGEEENRHLRKLQPKAELTK